MSEMDDSIVYNFYDYMKSIYLYSHVKTSLKDSQRQPIEEKTNYILCILSSFFIIVSLFKIFVIIFYFIFMQAFMGFIKFIISIFKTKFQISFCSSFTNAISYLAKVFKRIYTFNFYLYHNLFIGMVMMLSYFFFLISSFGFFIHNIQLLSKIEKPYYYLGWFYCHFESFILIQLLISSFYAYRKMNMSIFVGLSLFVILNIILILGYFATDKIENVDGAYEYSEPQSVIDIIFNSIFLFLNSICLYNVITYNKNCK